MKIFRTHEHSPARLREAAAFCRRERKIGISVPTRQVGFAWLVNTQREKKMRQEGKLIRVTTHKKQMLTDTWALPLEPQPNDGPGPDACTSPMAHPVVVAGPA